MTSHAINLGKCSLRMLWASALALLASIVTVLVLGSVHTTSAQSSGALKMELAPATPITLERGIPFSITLTISNAATIPPTAHAAPNITISISSSAIELKADSVLSYTQAEITQGTEPSCGGRCLVLTPLFTTQTLTVGESLTITFRLTPTVSSNTLPTTLTVVAATDGPLTRRIWPLAILPARASATPTKTAAPDARATQAAVETQIAISATAQVATATARAVAQATIDAQSTADVQATSVRQATLGAQATLTAQLTAQVQVSATAIAIQNATEQAKGTESAQANASATAQAAASARPVATGTPPPLLTATPVSGESRVPGGIDPIWLILGGILLSFIALLVLIYILWRMLHRPPPAPDAAYLMARPQNGKPFRVYLKKDRFTIGRAPDSDLVIDDRFNAHETVSDQHAVLEREGQDWILKDKGSAMGTYVQGLRSGNNRLRNGVRIAFGSVEFAFATKEPRS